MIDGHDIFASLRNAVAIVPQDAPLLNRSLMENIRYGRPEASDEEVWEAALAARCSEFIETLPAGLDTVVGDRGAQLSRGQRQRVAIARAFLKNSPIHLLDEATSALESEAEEAIRDALCRKSDSAQPFSERVVPGVHKCNRTPARCPRIGHLTKP